MIFAGWLLAWPPGFSPPVVDGGTMDMPRRPARPRALTVVAVGALLAVGALPAVARVEQAPAAPPGVEQPAAPPRVEPADARQSPQAPTGGDCAAAFPLAEIRPGQHVHGLTVERGTEPARFRGEVVGVLDDGIALDLDMILVELASPAMRRAGGVWAGMSGSPVYARDGRLLGAVAYGLAGATSVAGVTPAEEMLRLLDDDVSELAADRVADAKPRALPQSLQADLVARGAASSAQAAQGMQRLPVPLGISSLTPQRMQQVAEAGADYDFVPYRAAAAGAATEGAADAASGLRAGSNFAAALAYGDITAAGVGTTTTVCDGVALAFGHPFLFAGPTSLTAHLAEALYVQPDPSFVPFKVANPGPPIGTVTQDRLAGLRAELGSLPVPTPVSSMVMAGERSRSGTTYVNRDEDVADMTGFHLLANLDRVFDQVGSGRARVSWAVVGTTADGASWTLERTNRYASQSDIVLESTFEVVGQLAQLEANPYTPIDVISVDVSADVATDYRALRITGVEVAVGDGAFVPARELDVVEVEPGATLLVRVELTPYRTTTPEVVELALDVPDVDGADGELVVSGAGDAGFGLECLFEPELCATGDEEPADTFAGLVAQLESAPRNDEVVARIDLFGPGPEPIAVEASAAAEQVVTGFEAIPVFVVGDFGPEPPPEPPSEP